VGGSSGVGTRYRATEDSEGRTINSVPTPSHSVPLRPKDQPHLFEAPSQLRPDILSSGANPDGDSNNPGRTSNSVPTPSLRPSATPGGATETLSPPEGGIGLRPPEARQDGPPLDGLLPVTGSEKFSPPPTSPNVTPAPDNPTFEESL
jgi:hypothetical protein